MHSEEDCTGEDIYRRAINFLPLLVRGTATDSMTHLRSARLEWRLERMPEKLEEAGVYVKLRVPTIWPEWVDVLANLSRASLAEAVFVQILGNS